MCVFILKRLKSDKVTEKGEIRHFIPVLHCVGAIPNIKGIYLFPTVGAVS